MTRRLQIIHEHPNGTVTFWPCGHLLVCCLVRLMEDRSEPCESNPVHAALRLPGEKRWRALRRLGLQLHHLGRDWLPGPRFYPDPTHGRRARGSRP